MKRIFSVFFFMFLCRVVHADILADGGLQTSIDTKLNVNVSTTSGAGTQICVNDAYFTRTWIVNFSSQTLFISTSAATTTTTSFGIPGSATAGTAGAPFTPDGPVVPWWGPIFAVLNATSTAPNGNSVAVFRTK